MKPQWLLNSLLNLIMRFYSLYHHTLTVLQKYSYWTSRCLTCFSNMYCHLIQLREQSCARQLSVQSPDELFAVHITAVWHTTFISSCFRGITSLTVCTRVKHSSLLWHTNSLCLIHWLHPGHPYNNYYYQIQHILSIWLMWILMALQLIPNQ